MEERHLSLHLQLFPVSALHCLTSSGTMNICLPCCVPYGSSALSTLFPYFLPPVSFFYVWCVHEQSEGTAEAQQPHVTALCWLRCTALRVGCKQCWRPCDSARALQLSHARTQACTSMHGQVPLGTPAPPHLCAFCTFSLRRTPLLALGAFVASFTLCLPLLCSVLSVPCVLLCPLRTALLSWVVLWLRCYQAPPPLIFWLLVILPSKLPPNPRAGVLCGVY